MAEGNGNSLKLSLLASSALIWLSGEVALAQSASVGEVIVTAQRREQLIQDVPISIAVVGREQLEQSGAQSITDYIYTIPSLNFIDRGPGIPDISIRGIAGDAVGGIFDPFTVLIDGLNVTAYNTSPILSSKLFDLERIEVLRGPQGALDGSSALGGSISYVTRQPSTAGLSGELSLELARFDSQLLKGSVNVPVTDNFALRLSSYVEESDGPVTNIGPGGGGSTVENFGGRIAARWEPTQSITATASILHEDQSYGNDVYLMRDIYLSETQRTARIDTLTSLGGDYFALEFFDEAAPDDGVISLDYPSSTDVRFTLAGAKVAFDLGQYELAFQGGYFDYDLDRALDQDFSEYAVRRNDLERYQESRTLDARLTSNLDGPFNWLVGLSYLDEQSADVTIGQDGDGLLAGSYSFSDLSYYEIDYQSYSLYGNVTWNFAENFELAVGARMTREELLNRRIFTFSPTLPEVAAPLIENEEFLPRIALNYEASPDLTFYGTIADGYRSGFRNDPRVTDLGLAPVEVDAEKVRNYEVGVKGRLFDDRMSVSLALFNLDYQDIQVSNYTYVPTQGYIYFDVNQAEAYSRGFELEFAAAATENTEISGSLGWNEAKIQDFGADGDDVRFPVSRPWSATLGVTNSRPIREGLSLNSRAFVTYRSSGNATLTRSPGTNLDSFVSLDLSLGLETPRWSVTAFVDNATGDEYNIGQIVGQSLRGRATRYVPRMFGVRLTAKFGS